MINFTLHSSVPDMEGKQCLYSEYYVHKIDSLLPMENDRTKLDPRPNLQSIIGKLVGS